MTRVLLAAALLWLAMSPEILAADDLPLTIAASTVGRFGEGASWYLSVNSAGRAELTIGPRIGEPQTIRRQFELSQEQLSDFRQALQKASFFDLADEYGQNVPDGSTDTLTVICGDRVNSVRVGFLMNWVTSGELDKLQEPSRAVRLHMIVRGWFNDPEAVDLQAYDQRVLDALE